MKDERHRMSKEIAQELRDQLGEGAHLYCVEKLSNDTGNPQLWRDELWRDVLAWLDEVNNDPVEAGSQTKGESNERI